MGKLDNRGNTMVEIMVGFVLILIIIASFMQIIKLSSNMTMYSVDESKKLAQIQEEYYTMDATNMTNTPIAGVNESKDGYINSIPIKLVECKDDGTVKSGAKTFTLYNARLMRFDGATDAFADFTMFRMLYINRNEN
ncbi:MAG: hypothetical protein K6E47_10480 [Lachnospiraceae bacterium]|nr:hypothetical protein [Lachnospiraceae bacterium]